MFRIFKRNWHALHLEILSVGGWSGRFIGFREVVLATENVNKLKAPEEILRWIFRIFDSSGTGFIKTEKIKGMVEIIIE